VLINGENEVNLLFNLLFNLRHKIQNYIKEFLKRLFCKHDYDKAAWEEFYDSRIDMYYSRRLYVCNKCGKSYWIDGRIDELG